ncbi:hypothetical protein [Sinorhizobium mexicanum]|uniref:Uncharacterized protein n=1 Tax=Sinorhizobium mexicanum TaxID=375549 RepID=A0A859QCI9_9HYPH|nr:hypothetical protein [Sinorhizobium mexicanum]MBP1882375.1 hypothetical protein [Sinorhizobium mexicanum]QLL62083.1 hypothetical protein FKV68_11755 [Sinorhizobium mexicanum]
MKQQTALTRSVALMMPALVLAGCGISGPGDVTGLRRVVGTELAGTRGATAADQSRIDRTVVGLCAAAIWTKAECERHGGTMGAGRDD